MAQVRDGRIIFDSSDWLGGQIFQADALSEPRAGIGGTLSYSKAMNPYRFMGYAAPGYNPQDATNQNSLASSLRKGVVDGSSIYAVGATSDFAKISIGATPDVVDDATWPITISAHGGANTPIADDIVIYTHNVSSTPTRRAFYSWTDSVSWDIGNFDLSSTVNDDFMQTVPASPLASPYTTGGQGKKHPLEVGKDDILYAGDRHYVHAYDGATGTNGTFSAEVFTFLNGFELRSFVTFPGYLVGFAHRASSLSSGYYQGEVKAFFWDYLKQDPDYVFDLNDNYVGEAFIYDGTIGVFTQGRTNDLENNGTRNSKMQLFRGFGVGFTPELTFSSDVPERGGVWVNGDMVLWNTEGEVMSYGAPYKGMNRVVNSLAVGATSSTVSGMLINPTTSWYLFSPSTASGGRLRYLKSGNYADNCNFSTINVTPSFPEGMMGQLRAVKVRFAKVSSAGRVLRIVVANQAEDTTEVLGTAASFSAVTSSTIIKEFKKESNRLRFSGVKVYVEYSSGGGQSGAPIIDSIELFYDEVNIQK